MKKSKKLKNIPSFLSYLDIRRLKPYEIIWFFTIAFLGLFLTILVPPFEKPDEHVHFYKAVSISQGILHCQNPNQQYVYPYKFSELQSIVGKYGLTQNASAKFYYKDFFQPVIDVDGQSGKLQSIGAQVCGFPSIAYLPQSVGLAITNLFQIGGMYSFYVGRLFAYALFITVLLAILVNVRQNGRILFLAMASIPMLLHQVGSFSYDSAHITLSFVIGAFLFTFIESKAVRTKQLVAFLALLLIFFMVKGQAYIFFFLSPLLFIDKVKLRLGTYCISSRLIAACMSIAVIAGTIIAASSLHSYMMARPAAISPRYLQLQVLKEMPERLFEILWDTSFQQFSFYAHSFVGNLGWLDYTVGHSLYLIIIALLAISLSQFKFTLSQKFPVFKSILIAGILFGSYLVMLLGMYLFHTAYYLEIGGTLVEGIQGRYFLVFVPLVFFVIGLIKQTRLFKYILVGIVAIVISYQLIYSVFHRYYDYASLHNVPTYDDIKKSGTELVPLGSYYEQTITLEPDRKYIGFAFYSDQEEKFMPYWVKVYESSCENRGKLIGKGVLSANQHRGQSLVKIGKFSTTNFLEVCLALELISQNVGDYSPSSNFEGLVAPIIISN